MNSIDKAKWKIVLFSMFMAWIFVYAIKIPYLAFLMGGFTVMINNRTWKRRLW